MVVRCPVDMQRAKLDLHIDAAAGAPGQRAGDGRAACAGAAGERSAAAALPCARPHGMIVHNLDEVHVRAPREDRRVLHRVAQPRDVDPGQIVHKDHRVRHADQHAGKAQRLPVHGQLAVDAAPRPLHGDLLAVQERLAHVHAHAGHHAVLDQQRRAHDAGERFDREGGLFHDALLVHILGKAADAVAAHLRLAAVGIDDAHADVGRVAVEHEQQPVPAHAGLAVAERRCKRIEVGAAHAARIDDEKVIAQSMHFRKFHDPIISTNASSAKSRTVRSNRR